MLLPLNQKSLVASFLELLFQHLCCLWWSLSPIGQLNNTPRRSLKMCPLNNLLFSRSHARYADLSVLTVFLLDVPCIWHPLVSWQVLISSEESWIDHNVKAVPQSPLNEQLEPSNLPDCVPQEINSEYILYCRHAAKQCSSVCWLKQKNYWQLLSVISFPQHHSSFSLLQSLT